MAYSLHPQLAADCHAVADLHLSRVLLMDDARFPWLVLVPMRDGMREIFDLSAAEQGILMREISAVAEMLQATTKCSKINIAALGNQVPQLHVHIIGRRESDAAWPQPVWSCIQPRSHYASDELLKNISLFHTLLGRITGL